MTRYRIRFDNYVDRNTAYKVLDTDMNNCYMEDWTDIEIFCTSPKMKKIERWLNKNFSNTLIMKFETYYEKGEIR